MIGDNSRDKLNRRNEIDDSKIDVNKVEEKKVRDNKVIKKKNH